MTLYEALYLFGGLTGGTALGLVVSALFSGSKDAVAEDMLASLVEMRRVVTWRRVDVFPPVHEDGPSVTFGDYHAMLARADLAIRNATKQAAPIAAPQSYFE